MSIKRTFYDEIFHTISLHLKGLPYRGFQTDAGMMALSANQIATKMALVNHIAA